MLRCVLVKNIFIEFILILLKFNAIIITLGAVAGCIWFFFVIDLFYIDRKNKIPKLRLRLIIPGSSKILIQKYSHKNVFLSLSIVCLYKRIGIEDGIKQYY